MGGSTRINATRMGIMGAIVGGLNAKLSDWNSARADEAERLKQDRLEQILTAREGRQDTRTIASEGRAETRDIASEGRAEGRWKEQNATTYGQSAALQGSSQAHASMMQGNSQGFQAGQSALDRAQRTEEASLNRDATVEAAKVRNSSDKAVQVVIQNTQTNEQKLVLLQPGEAVPAGWQMITTNNASSPMPSGTKAGVTPRAPRGTPATPQRKPIDASQWQNLTK